MSSPDPYYKISPYKPQYKYGYQQQQSAQACVISDKVQGKKPRKARKYRTFALNFQVNNYDCFEDNAKLNVPELIEPSAPQPLIYALYSELAGAAYIKNFYAVVHDRDIDDYGEPVAKHVHILFDLASSEKEQPSLTVANVSAITGLKKQQIAFPKNEHFFNNMAAYLIHAAEPFKASYAPDEVMSYCDEDSGGISYQDLYNKRYAIWTEARMDAYEKTVSEPKYLRILVHMIKRGLFGPTGKGFLSNDFWMEVYGASSKNHSAVDNACLTYNSSYQEACLHAFAAGLFGKAAVFVCGDSGAGKSTLCELITERIKQKTLEFDIPWYGNRLSGRNALDRYKSEQIITFEDIRASKISSDQWCLLLDPNLANSAEARFRDVAFLARFVMLNQTKDIVDFFTEMAMKGEPIDQFLRRFSYQIEVRKFYSNGITEHKARLVPIVKSKEPIYIETNPDDYLPQKIELNYAPDENKASDWMTFDQVADKVAQFALEQCQNLGLVPGKLDVVRNISGKDINTGFRQAINSVLLTNTRVPKIPKVVVGTKNCTVDSVLQPAQGYQQPLHPAINHQKSRQSLFDILAHTLLKLFKAIGGKVFGFSVQK